eukprot:7470367-Lingulodinium_polyedra.AAC.1
MVMMMMGMVTASTTAAAATMNDDYNSCNLFLSQRAAPPHIVGNVTSRLVLPFQNLQNAHQ